MADAASADGRRPPDRDGGGLGRLRPQLALIVPLAQRHTLHPQDVVGGDGMEMEAPRELRS
jgi:hypothetical protein